MVGCYCRVSCDSQDTAMQRAEIRKWLKSQKVKSNGYRWYTDKMPGWVKRPGLDKLLMHASKGTIDTVVVFDLSRLARSTKMGLEILTPLLESDIRFISLRQNLDWGGMYGHFLLTVFLAFAELERSVIRDRVVSGVRRKIKEQKGRWGRPRDTKKLARIKRLVDRHGVRRTAEMLSCTRQNIYAALRKVND